MLYLRIFQHLLPRAEAWKITTEKTLRKFFEGLAESYRDVRVYIDLVYEDLFPTSTRALDLWEQHFGLLRGPTEQARRMNVDAAWKATGGQSPRYIQDVLQAAGFDVYVHEWWDGTEPRVRRDPRLYTSPPAIGTVQCGEPLALCGEPSAVCDGFLANDPGYLVNETLTLRPPPPIPANDDFWPYFLYVGGEVFGTPALIDASRKREFERLVLKICPAHLWIVLLVEYIATVFVVDDAGNTIVDDDGNVVII
jgi:hypothetical protein